MEIATARLRLREFSPADVDAVWAYQADPRYQLHNGRRSPTREEAEALVAMLCAWQHESPRCKYQLAITLDGALIGTCGVRKAEGASREAEFGCELDPRHWGHGYALEASRAIVDFGFSGMGLARVVAITAPANTPAIRLAEALGFRRVEAGQYVLVRP